MDLKFSIVIPNYNSGPALERALRSLLAQDRDLQLILVDACSSDESREIVERYRPKLDTVIVEKDDGQADALNKGFARATGDIFAWLCADDELLPGALNEVERVFAAIPDTGVVFGACERVYADGSRATMIPDQNPWQKIGIQDVVEQPSTFWRADLHRRLGPLDTSFQLAFDWDLWCRMARAGARFSRTEQVLARYYFTAANKTSRAGGLFAREAFVILRRYGPLNGRLADVYRLLYRHFDLYGCFDQPRTCGRLRELAFFATHRLLRATIRERLLGLYNWHFASLQERGKQWW